MKISYQWLKDYVAFDYTAEQLAEKLTSTGLEVESFEPIERIKGGMSGLVIGQVLTCEKHPNADTLRLTTVDVGQQEALQIVCGAPNVAVDQKVVVATIGATLFPTSGDVLKIKKSKIRGVESFGMLCAEDEIGLSQGHDGILVLATDLPNGTPAADFFGFSEDYCFEIGLTPNRAEAASHLGVARDIVALTGHSLIFPKQTQVPEGLSLASPINIQVLDYQSCPRYAGIYITDVKADASPKWLVDRLKSIGLNSINLLVDATNYVLHALGQPLHAFDADQIAQNQLIVRKAKPGETLTLLDGKNITLQESDLVIADAEKPLCLAGIMGGISSGVRAETQNIFIESAYFQPDTIRQSVRLHGLRSDSSFRFERGTDPAMVLPALFMAAHLIAELCGAKVVYAPLDLYPDPIQPKQIEVTFKRLYELIGYAIEVETMQKILINLGFDVQTTPNAFVLKVPTYRVDVLTDADIAEEILRIFGFDQIPLSDNLQTSFLASFPSLNKNGWLMQLRNQLAGAGFFEVMNNSLTNHAFYGQQQADDFVFIANPLSQDLTMMRKDLVWGGLQNIAHNINRKQNNLKLFEIGQVYKKNVEASGYIEQEQVGFWVSGNVSNESWLRSSQAYSLPLFGADIMAVLQNFLPTNQLEKLPFAAQGFFAFGLELKKGQQVVGRIGSVDKAVLKQFGIKQEVFFAHFDVAALLSYAKKTPQYKPYSKFPSVRRDLSLVVDKKVSFDQILEVTNKIEKKLIAQVNVFDVYTGDKLPEGQKSYAVSFTLEDNTQTLEDQQIDKVMEKLIAAFETQLSALIRR